MARGEANRTLTIEAVKEAMGDSSTTNFTCDLCSRTLVISDFNARRNTYSCVHQHSIELRCAQRFIRCEKEYRLLLKTIRNHGNTNIPKEYCPICWCLNP